MRYVQRFSSEMPFPKLFEVSAQDEVELVASKVKSSFFPRCPILEPIVE
jgi:hypothetical protein